LTESPFEQYPMMYVHVKGTK